MKTKQTIAVIGATGKMVRLSQKVFPGEITGYFFVQMINKD